LLKEKFVELARKIKLRKRIYKLKRFDVYVILIVITVVLLFPILFTIANSFMSDKEVLDTYQKKIEEVEEGESTEFLGFKLIPDMVSMKQYYTVLFRKPTFLLMFLNSAIMTIPIVIIQVIVGVFAAYAFAKLRFPLRDKLFFVFIVVMLMPLQVTLVPNYILLRKLDMIGSFLSVILPGGFSAFGVVLLRQYMRGIPDECCEAAMIDGAGYLKTFTKIILPQCKSIIASLAILAFIDNWNMVEQPLIFLSDSAKYPLSVYLAYINEGDLGLAFASGVLYMIPTVLIYLYGEKYFVEGIQLTGIK